MYVSKETGFSQWNLGDLRLDVDAAAGELFMVLKHLKNWVFTTGILITFCWTF